MAGLYVWKNQGNFNIGDAAVAFGVGATAGALIGTGVGASAGAAILTGAGVGMASAGAVNLATNKEGFDAIDFVVDSAVGGLNGAVANVTPVNDFGVGGMLWRAGASTILESAGYATKEVLHGSAPTVSGLSASALTGFSSSILADGVSATFDGHLGQLLRGSTPMPRSHGPYLNELEAFIDVWVEQSYILGKEILSGTLGTVVEKGIDQIREYD